MAHRPLLRIGRNELPRCKLLVRRYVTDWSGLSVYMVTWLGQLVVTKGSSKGSAYKVQYWRTPSMTPALIGFRDVDALRNYLRHVRLSGSTPDGIIEQLQSSSQVTINTFESEEAVS